MTHKKNLFTSCTKSKYAPPVQLPEGDSGIFSKMIVKVRSQEKCPLCNQPFRLSASGLTCPKHAVARPETFYLDWWHLGQNYRLHGFSSFKESFKRACSIEESINSFTFRPELYRGDHLKVNKRFTFCEVWEGWLKSREKDLNKNSISPGYFKKLQQCTNIFTAFFKKEDVRSIKKYRIREFYESLPDKLNPKTAHNILSILKKFFNDLADDDLIQQPPRFPKIKVNKPEVRWLIREQQLQILQHIPDRHKPIFIFMFNTGCRPGEARALLWSDVDFTKGMITIRHNFSAGVHRPITKGKKSRVIPMSNEITELLSKHPKTLRNNFVFNTHYGKPYGSDRLGKLWREACKKAGIEGVTCYGGTRHSFASQLVNDNISLPIIGAWLGHSNNTTTEKYAHTNLDGMRSVLKEDKR